MRRIDFGAMFAVTEDYRPLLEFSVGIGGWFVPEAVRESAARSLRELADLRLWRDNNPAERQLREENALLRAALEDIALETGTPYARAAQAAPDAAKGEP